MIEAMVAGICRTIARRTLWVIRYIWARGVCRNVECGGVCAIQNVCMEIIKYCTVGIRAGAPVHEGWNVRTSVIAAHHLELGSR